MSQDRSIDADDATPPPGATPEPAVPEFESEEWWAQKAAFEAAVPSLPRPSWPPSSRGTP